MTIAFADTLDRQDRTDLIRWGVSLLLVIVFHFVAALWLLSREAPVEPNKPPPPAALLDLPPLPLAGAGGAPGVPAPPKPAAIQPRPKPPAPEVKPVPPPAPASIPKFAVPLPEAPKPTPLAPKPQPPRATSLPPQPTGSAAPVLLDAVRVWQLGVVNRIEKFKSWPPMAVQYRLTGVVGLRIEIDRQGNILAYSLAASSGYAVLDQATLDMARQARRLPPLPPEIAGQVYEFVLSVQWL